MFWIGSAVPQGIYSGLLSHKGMTLDKIVNPMGSYTPVKAKIKAKYKLKSYGKYYRSYGKDPYSTVTLLARFRG